MRSLRRVRWEEEVKLDDTDLDRVFEASEMLHEDIQDQSSPMVIVGTDVESHPGLQDTMEGGGLS